MNSNVKTQDPMDRFVQSIENSVKTENWYAALVLVLTIPDICGWVETPIVGSQKRYEAWFEKYLLPTYKSPFHGSDFTFLSGSDCYALRCAFLHEGTDEILRQRARDVVSRFAFSTTGSHRCMFENVLLLNVQMFCAEVCAGTRQWIRDVSANPDAQSRLNELLQVHTKSFQVVPGVLIR